MKTETLNLNTFGNNRYTKQRCDIITLSPCGKEDVRISALCFLKIFSPLATNMDISRYPHLQGLDFADVMAAVRRSTFSLFPSTILKYSLVK